MERGESLTQWRLIIVLCSIIVVMDRFDLLMRIGVKVPIDLRKTYDAMPWVPKSGELLRS